MRRVVRRGESIFSQGQPVAALHVVSRGDVKIVRLRDDGTEQILRLAGPGDLIGYRALAAGERYVANAVALTDVEVVSLPVDEVKREMAASGPWLRDLLLKLSTDLREAEDRIEELSHRPVRDRVADLLRRLADPATGWLRVDLKREELASLAGTATESFIRALKVLKKEGVIETKGRRLRVI
jgi:CRP-like cAMP-binding protein